jgi:integrase
MSALHLVHSVELDPAEERIVMLVLSRFIGESEGWRAYTYNLCRIVAALDGLDVVRNPDGTLKERPWRSGKLVIQAHKDLDPKSLDRKWVAARTQGRPLERELLAEFVPEMLWPSIATLMCDGPDETIAKARNTFDCWAVGLFSNGEERPAGARAASNLQVYIAALWSLMRRLCDLRESLNGADREYLKEWKRQSLPKAPLAEEFNAEEAARDRSAPPLIAVRRALKGLDARIQHKKRLAHQRKHLFEELRNRAMFALLAIHGMRAEALWALNVENFLPQHEFPDGSRGAALIVPRVKRERVEHAKYVPQEVADWIQEYLAYIDAKPGEPMWRPKQKARRGERLTQQMSTDVLIRYLSPHCEGRLYSPHTMRHLASSLATLVGIEWIRERPAAFLLGAHGMPSAPQTFSDVLLGHALHHIADRYRDMDSKQSREIWTKITVEGIWEWIWGDKGARKGPDLKLISDAEQKAERAQIELRGVEAKLDQLEGDAQHATRMAEKDLLVLLVQLTTTSRELAKATAIYERAARRLDDARSVTVAIDDAAAEMPEMPESELELASRADEERPLVRTEILPAEFCWAIGVDILKPSTLRRWMSGKLPFSAGDPRNLFEPPAPGERFPEAVHYESEHKRYILLDKLDPKRFHPDAWERLLEICRRPMPKPPTRKKSGPRAPEPD